MEQAIIKTQSTEQQKGNEILKNIPVKLPYLKTTEKNKYSKSEYGVFLALGKLAKNYWFNDKPLDENSIERAFILYVRSNAINRYIGNKMTFTNKWDSNQSFIKRITENYLKNKNIETIKKEYNELYQRAQNNKDKFIIANTWLKGYLGKNLGDFEQGVLYFFMEHDISDENLNKKIADFKALENKAKNISNYLIEMRKNQSRYSPSKSVDDEQIREIVAACIFGEVFYKVDAFFTLAIIAKESNFDMTKGSRSVGVTQQTINGGGVLSLQSSYWRKRTNKAIDGIKIERQIVSMALLSENIFANVLDGVKTIAVKAAEINKKTENIKKENRKILYNIAYKYNGHPDYASQYAKDVISLYENLPHSMLKDNIYSKMKI